MRRGTSGHGAIAATLVVVFGLWFLGSLYQVAWRGDDLRFEAGLRLLHGVGISLPWAALFVAIFLEEEFPAAARRLVLGVVGAALLLATAAAIRHLWIEPKLGNAVLALDADAAAVAVHRMWSHDLLLTVHGPLLSLAAWLVLRWFEGRAARPHRRLG
ncbi:MAG TPA: hypothetical protein VFS92_10635, partial [Planctomycetota bacterium]|nr:hypothetical protein [Planctomycetota bacterium]